MERKFQEPAAAQIIVGIYITTDPEFFTGNRIIVCAKPLQASKQIKDAEKAIC